MNEQKYLFPFPSGEGEPSRHDGPRCHAHDPSTSFEAIETFRSSGRLGLHHRIVLDGVRHCPGGTHSEIAEGTCLDWLQVARRLPELERRRLVKKGPVRLCRIKDSRCVTWWLTSGGER